MRLRSAERELFLYKLDATVNGAARGDRIIRDGIGIANTFSGQPAAINAVLDQPIQNGLGAALRERLVCVRFTGVIGVAFNANFPIGIGLQRAQSVIQSGTRTGKNVGLAGGKADII